MISLPKNFIGRKKELERLKMLHNKHSANLVVIKGRRRIGKSRLISEFASKNPKNKFWSFAGLAPVDGVTAQSQRDHFAKQLALLLKIPPFTFQDWTDAFEHLSLHLHASDIILFDEISWMGFKDPSFIPKLKAWWDKQTKNITVVFCGSVSTWIEENILKSTAFFGRVNLVLTLEPLTLSESKELLEANGFKTSTYDFYKILSILGGIPWYLEQIHKTHSADENIKRLCFEKDGLLVSEFERIFHDLFHSKGTTYKKILNALKTGIKTLAAIREIINFPHSGSLTKIMDQLVTAGFIQKQNLWSFKTEKSLKKSLYRIYGDCKKFCVNG